MSCCLKACIASVTVSGPMSQALPDPQASHQQQQSDVHPSHIGVGVFSAHSFLPESMSQVLTKLAATLKAPLPMQASHLQQHSIANPSSPGAGVLSTRSFLGGLLPESLLYVLTTSGAGAFAAAMVEDTDSPELVWTHRMRAERLVPQVGVNVTFCCFVAGSASLHAGCRILWQPWC